MFIEYIDGEVRVAPEYLVHPILQPLIQKYEEKALLVLYFMRYPIRNPYMNIVEKERFDYIVNDLGIVAMESHFEKALGWMDHLMAEHNSIYSRTMMSINIVDTALQTLKSIDYSERTARGSLVWKPSEVVGAMTKLKAEITALSDNLMKFSLEEKPVVSVGVKGRAIGMFEKPVAIERKKLE